MNILKKINKMRLDRNWSVYRLSVESGVSQSTLTNMFNRETLPSITTLELLCNAFEVTMAEFFTEPEDTLEHEVSDRELSETYHALSADAQKAIFALMKELGRK